MRSFAAVAVALAFLGATSASAKKMGSTLNALTADSDVIVVGRVVRVSTEGGYRVATLSVTAELKGRGAKEVTFIASPTWTCDESFAVEGEQLLLFLSSELDPSVRKTSEVPSPLYSITHSGTGRMPIVEDDGVVYALFLGSFMVPKDWDEFRLPAHKLDATPLMPALAATSQCISRPDQCLRPTDAFAILNATNAEIRACRTQSTPKCRFLNVDLDWAAYAAIKAPTEKRRTKVVAAALDRKKTARDHLAKRYLDLSHELGGEWAVAASCRASETLLEYANMLREIDPPPAPRRPETPLEQFSDPPWTIPPVLYEQALLALDGVASRAAQEDVDSAYSRKCAAHREFVKRDLEKTYGAR